MLSFRAERSGVEKSLIVRGSSERCLDFARHDKRDLRIDMNDDLQTRIEEAVKNPRNLGEMKTPMPSARSAAPDCGDMLRMWIKFKEENGRKVIDRATFQSFGCQTAIAVASVATEMLAGKRSRRRNRCPVKNWPRRWVHFRR